MNLNKKSAVVLFSALFGVNAFCSMAQAATYTETKIAQWGDPTTLPHTRTRCVKEAKGDIFGREWSSCVGWATDTQTMQVELFMKTEGPEVAENVSNAVKAALATCVTTASSAAGSAALGAPSPEIAARLAAGAAAGVASFKSCVVASAATLSTYGLSADKFNLAFDSRTHWSNWSNE